MKRLLGAIMLALPFAMLGAIALSRGHLLDLLAGFIGIIALFVYVWLGVSLLFPLDKD